MNYCMYNDNIDNGNNMYLFIESFNISVNWYYEMYIKYIYFFSCWVKQVLFMLIIQNGNSHERLFKNWFVFLLLFMKNPYLHHTETTQKSCLILIVMFNLTLFSANWIIFLFCVCVWLCKISLITKISLFYKYASRIR